VYLLGSKWCDNRTLKCNGLFGVKSAAPKEARQSKRRTFRRGIPEIQKWKWGGLWS